MSVWLHQIRISSALPITWFTVAVLVAGACLALPPAKPETPADPAYDWSAAPADHAVADDLLSCNRACEVGF